MKIGIDGNEANVKKRVGVNVYAFQLLWQLYRLGQKATDKQSNERARYAIYLKSRPLEDLPPETSWWQYQVFGPKQLWTQWRLPLQLYKETTKPDVFFTPSHYAPRFSPVPTVIAVMDLAFLRFPQDFRQSDLRQLTRWTAYSVKQAAHILAISQATKADVVKFYGIDPSRITVTYPGYDKERFRAAGKHQGKTKAVLEKYGIQGKYLVYVGTLQPRKNVVRLIEAFSPISRRYPQVQLVIVGKKGWLYEDIFASVNRLNLQGRVVFTGFVPDEEEPILLKNAQAFVLPSLYEGFGIPVVEAMACGVPVVVSQVSSLPELAGKAGIYISNPKSVKEISEALRKVLELSQRKRNVLVAKGLTQAKQFSWETCGQKTIRTLREAAKTS